MRRRRLVTGLTAVLVIVGVVFGIRALTSSSGGKDDPERPATQGVPSVNTVVNPSGRPAELPGPVDPAFFAPGACVSYPPTVGDRHLTVFLDAGHGGVDPGAVGTTEGGRTIEEANLTLPVEMDTATILRGEGFRVVVSRTGNTSVARTAPGDVDNGVFTVEGSHDDVAARAVCANDAHADILVGIYFNSGSPNNAGSVTGYDAVRPFAADNLRLAELIQGDVLSAMNAHHWGIPDDGVLPDSDLGSALSAQSVAYGHLLLLGPAEAGYFSTPSEMPGALIEPLFVTDPFEGQIAASALGQQVIATGLANAIEHYFPPPVPPSPPTSL
jgi:N-acetylmuramoyl-L-alanine amidase